MLARSGDSVDPQFMNLFVTEFWMQMKAHQQVSASDYILRSPRGFRMFGFCWTFSGVCAVNKSGDKIISLKDLNARTGDQRSLESLRRLEPPKKWFYGSGKESFMVSLLPVPRSVTPSFIGLVGSSLWIVWGRKSPVKLMSCEQGCG